MKIEIWSDFVCPFCYIGKRKLDHALAQLPFIQNVQIEFKSYELDQNAPLYSGVSINEAISRKYGVSLAEATKMNQQIGEHALHEGLHFDFEAMKPTNTLDAHRITKLAKHHHLESQMVNALYAAYFEKGQLISDHDVLLTLATSIGLPENEVKDTLANQSTWLKDVRDDENQARVYQITGAPYFLIDETYAIKGAQPVELFIKALTDAWSNAQTNQFADDNELICDDNGCHIPQ